MPEEATTINHAKEHGEISASLKHITNTIDDIKDSFEKALDIKGKVDDHHGQIKKIWEKQDTIQTSVTSIDKKLDSLQISHTACQTRQSDERKWGKDRIGSLLDKIAWAIAVVIAGAAVYFAGKGGIFK